MKKELLLATALVGSLGLASSAQAVSMSMSGSHVVGVEGESADGASATDSKARSGGGSGLALSLSETTDSGMQISSGFSIMNESTGFSNSNSGLTLTFTDGSALDLVSAGNASDSHDVAIPASAGEEGIAYSAGNAAAGGIDMGQGGDAVGFEYKSAADALGISGMSFGVSASFNNDAATSTSASAYESGYGVGVTYVTSAGDTSVTLGAGYSQADSTNTAMTKDEAIMHVGISAVTGNLTVGAGYGTGDTFNAGTGATSTDAQQVDASVTEAGITYVSGDMTFNVGMVNSEASDEDAGQSGSAVDDSKAETSASVSYAVASGVTAILGWTSQEEKLEGTKTDGASGSSWYVGAEVN
jgi:hypothetical protein